MKNALAYVKTTWHDGDVITAEKLNKIETGVHAAAVMPSVSASDNGKVWGVANGAFGLLAAPAEPLLLTATAGDGGAYTFDVTPEALAAAVAAKRQVAVYVAVDAGLSAPVPAMIPLRQVIGTEYRFVGITSLSTTGNGASIAQLTVSPANGALVGALATGTIGVTLDTSGD